MGNREKIRHTLYQNVHIQQHNPKPFKMNAALAFKAFTSKKDTNNLINFVKHTEWNNMVEMKSVMAIFTKWYTIVNDGDGHFNHPKHAFNSLCKHSAVGKLEFNKFVLNDASTMWIFNPNNGDKKWLFIATNDDISTVASADNNGIRMFDVVIPAC